MTQAIDLDAYFRRIGYVGAREPTRDTLAALHLGHARSIAFENLNPLLGWPVRLDATSLERKLIHDGPVSLAIACGSIVSRALRPPAKHAPKGLLTLSSGGSIGLGEAATRE
jgi:hypothetical protein